MKNLTLLDEKFDINKTTDYHISIQIALDSYAFCIIDTITNKYLTIKNVNFQKNFESAEKNIGDHSFLDKIKEILTEDEFLNKEYKSVKFVYITKKATLVPSNLFIANEIKSYFSYNHTLEDSESINYDKFQNIDAYCIFAIPGFLTTLLVNKYKKIKFYHQTRPAIEYITSKPYRDKLPANQKKVFVTVYKDFFDVLVADNTGLLLHNSYDFKNEMDMVFYILNIYEQTRLSPQINELVMSGNIMSTSNSIVELKKLIKNINFLKLNNQYNYSKAFADLPEHSFVNLFNLYGCA